MKKGSVFLSGLWIVVSLIWSLVVTQKNISAQGWSAFLMFFGVWTITLMPLLIVIATLKMLRVLRNGEVQKVGGSELGGVLLMIGCLAMALLYMFGCIFAAIITVGIVVGIAVFAVAGILVWIGHTMATTPEMSTETIEEITKRIDGEKEK